MAESKSTLIARSVQKHAGRAKEKILQNLGKVDRTSDEIFEEHLQNFTRQQNAANRLQKEFNNYIRCVRAVQTASKSLLDSLCEIYESGWTGHDLLYVQAQNIEMLWQDFNHKLGDQVLIPLNTYQSQFPEMRKKVDKRGRKLVDYDSQRHNYQSLQAAAASGTKKRDENKISKARDTLEEAKRTYEMLNSELHDELPALYDSRALFLVTNLQTLFAAEQLFHSETAKVYTELEAVVDKLATECQRGSYTLKKNNSSPKSAIINNMNSSITSAPHSAGSSAEPVDCVTQFTNQSSPSSTATKLATLPSSDAVPHINGDSKKQNNNSIPASPTSPTPSSPDVNETPVANNSNTSVPATNSTNANSSTPTSPTNGKAPNANSNKLVEELYDIPVGATTDNLPPGVLYRVKATYKYNREDVDELSFDVGEIVRVVEYDDPEEQEEGWLMGIKEGTGEKGMFPANFTRPL
ncbi:myc box-dependent-interacting protein 1 isoform X2 [Frankliniella occidentalis]|uniref:Myc box-dependent-interacting protein 1 isoform X2 n=1 Tax=Frankliniella occidentalis TaxID=133901 RepID=A0A9C6XQD5_FRAOC|nr:myc box-dependent-interacting protein 1 isoform X2 [Frankliniella occidentalis]